jgi:cell division protease FtsH
MNSNFRNFALWVVIGLLLVALFNMFSGPTQQGGGTDIAYSQFLSEVDNGRIRDVTIMGQQITGFYTDGSQFQTFAPDDPNWCRI